MKSKRYSLIPALLAVSLLAVSPDVAHAQAKPQKSSQAKSQKSTQSKKTEKAKPKKSDTKAKSNKKADTKAKAKKSTTQPSKDGKGVIPVSSHDADGKTLLEGQKPTEEELSLANKALLAKNAELERQVNVLTNQNNVLTQEKSGQLFMYGTMTALFSVILGGLVAKLFGSRKERW